MNTAPNARPARRALPFVLAALLLANPFIHSRAEETNAPAAPAARTEDATNTVDALRSYLQLQEQLQATQLALERNRRDSETLAARNAEAIAMRLQLLEQAMSAQRARDLETMQSANRLLLIVAGLFAVMGFAAMLLTAYLQWRAVNRLAEFTALLPAVGRAALPPPGPTETRLVSAGVTEQSNARLFGALTHLENRILELEHTAHTPLAEKTPSPGAAATTTTPSPDAHATNHSDHLALLLAKGQSLLNLDKAGEALACYDEVLAQAPNHPEALVKKGVALEQLRQIEDALRCYDSAIAADSSLTVAYLQKGGLFNRLERYEEALQCYEEALRSQEKARAS
jgi:tetratricopeptide (TPR) repeat protein